MHLASHPAGNNFHPAYSRGRSVRACSSSGDALAATSCLRPRYRENRSGQETRRLGAQKCSRRAAHADARRPGRSQESPRARRQNPTAGYSLRERSRSTTRNWARCAAGRTPLPSNGRPRGRDRKRELRGKAGTPLREVPHAAPRRKSFWNAPANLCRAESRSLSTRVASTGRPRASPGKIRACI